MIRTSMDLWPVVVFTLEGELTLADADVVALESDRALDRREKHACIFDGSRVTSRPSALVRKRLADYTLESGPRSKQWAVCTAIVVPNALLRGVMTAIHWLSPPTIPVQSWSTYAEALDWCGQRLKSEGVMLPPSFGARRAGGS